MKPPPRTRALLASLAVGACLAACAHQDPAPVADHGVDGPVLPDRGATRPDLEGDGTGADAPADTAPPADTAAAPDGGDGAAGTEDRGIDADLVADSDGLDADAADGDALATDVECGPYPHWNLHLGQCLPSCGRVMGDAALAKEGTEANYLAYGTCLVAHPADPCDPALGHYLAQTWDCGTACCIYPAGDGGQTP